MLKLKYFRDHWFAPFRINGGTEGFNEFVKNHPPRNTKNQSGIITNAERGGTFLFYEEGEVLGPKEQIASLKEQIREKKFELVMGEPLYRVKLREGKETREELAKIEMELRGLEGADSKEERAKIKDLRDRQSQVALTAQALEQFVAISRGNQLQAHALISALESVIADIENESFEV